MINKLFVLPFNEIQVVEKNNGAQVLQAAQDDDRCVPVRPARYSLSASVLRTAPRPTTSASSQSPFKYPAGYPLVNIQKAIENCHL